MQPERIHTVLQIESHLRALSEAAAIAKAEDDELIALLLVLPAERLDALLRVEQILDTPIAPSASSSTFPPRIKPTVTKTPDESGWKVPRELQQGESAPSVFIRLFEDSLASLAKRTSEISAFCWDTVHSIPKDVLADAVWAGLIKRQGVALAVSSTHCRGHCCLPQEAHSIRDRHLCHRPSCYRG